MPFFVRWGVMTPRLTARASAYNPYLSIIDKYSIQFNVPANLIKSIIIQESGGNPKAWNPSNGENSRGLMQISQNLATGDFDFNIFTLSKLFDPDTNIKTGTNYLAKLRDQLSVYFDDEIFEMDKWKIIVSSYNQGTAYYIKALKALRNEGTAQSWEKVTQRMIIDGVPRSTKDAISVYGPTVMSYLIDSDLKVNGKYTTGSSSVLYKAIKVTQDSSFFYVMAILAVGGVAYYYYNKKGMKYGNQPKLSFV